MLKDWEHMVAEEEQLVLETIEIEGTEEDEGELPEAVPLDEVVMEPLSTRSWEGADADSKKSSRHSDADPTQLYLVEIGASPLLTAAEEVHYARFPRKGNSSARNHMVR